MKAGSATFVEHAHVVLARAGVMLTAGLNEDAARAAHMASFHVAQAYIFERTDIVSKSHKGVQIEFFRLSQIDPRVDQDLRKFISRSYEFKSIADYFSSADATISPQQATEALATAKRFVAHFSELADLAP